MRWLTLALALASALIVAAASLPATWVAAAFTRWVSPHGHVRLADAAGSVWAGACTLVIADGPQGAALPGRLQWKVAPLPLLVGRLAVTLTHPALSEPLNLSLARQWEASPGGARLPASLLSNLGAPFNTLRPEGDLELTWSRLNGQTGAQPTVLGTVTLSWHQAASRLTPVRPLGSYRVLANGQGRDVQLTLTTLQGPLQLQGNGRWTVHNGVRFEGSAFTEPQMRSQLDTLIGLLGPRSADRAVLKYP